MILFFKINKKNNIFQYEMLSSVSITPPAASGRKKADQQKSLFLII